MTTCIADRFYLWSIFRNVGRILMVSCLLAVMVFFDCPVSGAQEENDFTGPSLDSFNIIFERNIFDPNRRKARPVEDRPRDISTPPPPKVERFYLVGAILYEGDAYAFFEGTEYGLSKVVSPGDRYEGYEIVDVDVNGVKISDSTNTIEIAVGKGMIREGTGEWKIDERGSYEITVPPTPSDNAEDKTKTAPSVESGGDAAADARARMMARRKQELAK